MGDINESLGKGKKFPFFRKISSMGFQQLINEPTCETGSIIDHIYVNRAMRARNV